MPEVTIKHRGFTYDSEIDGPYGPVRVRKFATQGETVKVSKRDYEKGTEIGAFVTEEDEAEESDEFLNVVEASDDELEEWLREEKPTVDEVVAAADGDPESAQRLLDAENAVTDGDPRKGVADGLAAVAGSAE